MKKKTLALTLLAGCGNTQGDSAALSEEDLNKAAKISVGFTNYALPAVIAREKGFFQEEFGTEIEYDLEFFANGGPAAMEALESGSNIVKGHRNSKGRHCLWQILGSTGHLNTSILPTPEKILLAFKTQLRTGKWQVNLEVSVMRVLIGFVIGSLSGVIVGILTGIFHKFERAVAVIFGLLRSIPMMGLVPLFILWCGIGESSKITVIAIGTFWSVFLNTQQGIETRTIYYGR